MRSGGNDFNFFLENFTNQIVKFSGVQTYAYVLSGGLGAGGSCQRHWWRGPPYTLLHALLAFLCVVFERFCTLTILHTHMFAKLDVTDLCSTPVKCPVCWLDLTWILVVSGNWVVWWGYMDDFHSTVSLYHRLRLYGVLCSSCVV